MDDGDRSPTPAPTPAAADPSRSVRNRTSRSRRPWWTREAGVPTLGSVGACRPPPAAPPLLQPAGRPRGRLL